MSIEHEEKVVRRKKRTSKKTKKGWRKGSDITDVETFLEKARGEEIKGHANEKDRGLIFSDDRKLRSAKKDRKAPVKELRCHRGLILESLVPPLHVSQKVPKSKERPVRRSASKQSKEKPIKTLAPKQGQKRPAGPSGFYDLWASETKPSEDVDEHFANVCKKRRVKPPAHHSVKPSAIKSLEIPLPGASYNPTPKDHQDLMLKAIEVEEKKEREEMKLKRALDDFFPDETEKSSEVMWLKEMAAGLAEDEDDEDKDKKGEAKEEDDSVTTSSFGATQNRKKTKRQKRLVKERLLAEKTREKEREDRIRDSQKFRLKTIKKEIKQREFKLATKAAWRELEKEERKSQPKKLGRLSYEEPTIAVKLTDELVDSLRVLKPEGHVAEMMYKHLQKKNIIEPRKRAKPNRRTKSKLFEKKDHKAITL